MLIFQGIWTGIAKKPYFCDFHGVGGPLDPPMFGGHWTVLCDITSKKIDSFEQLEVTTQNLQTGFLNRYQIL